MKIQTSAQRLAAARASAAKFKADRPDWVAYHDWRTLVVRPFKRQQANVRRSEDGRELYADSFEALGWRQCGDSHDIAPRAVRHTGWYCDQQQSGVIRGAVVQIPARGGVPRYYAATYCTEWDGVTVHLDDWSDELEDSAYRADECARIEAEESREAYAKDQAETDIEQAREDIRATNKQARELIREIKAAGAAFSPAICAALRDRLADFLAERRRQFRIIEKRQADYWTAVEGY